MRSLSSRSTEMLFGLGAAFLACRTAAAFPISMVGGDQILWAYRLNEADPPQLQFAFATSDKRGVRFLSLQLATGAAVQLAAVRGDNLHVFFQDGTHYRIRPRQPGEPLGTNDFPERNLPGAFLPIALCGDDNTDSLGAIVPTSVAVDLPPVSATQPAATTAPADDVDPEPQIVVEPAGYTIVSYLSNRWHAVCPVPTFFDDQKFCRLAAHGGTYHLFFADGQSPRTLRYAACTDAQWTQPQDVPGVIAGDVFCAFATMETVALVVRGDALEDGGSTVRTVTLSNGKWRENATLRHDGAELICWQGRTAFHRLGNSVAMVRSVQQHGVDLFEAGIWPLEGGAPQHRLERVDGLMARQQPFLSEKTRMAIASVVLTLMLVIVFLRRRECFLTDLPTPPGYVLAALGRRFVAFVIDSVLVGSVTIPALIGPWVQNHIDMSADLAREFEYAIALYPGEFYWRWMAVAGLYMLYCIFFEWVMAATLGKRLLGLRVYDGKGLQCSFWAIVLRNLLRFELYFMLQFAPTAILVALTRNRQRLGDLIARTIVVERMEEG